MVVVRCRPLNEREVQRELERGQAAAMMASGAAQDDSGYSEHNPDNQGCVRITARLGLVEIRRPGLDTTDPGKSFTFDTVYDWNSKQSELYTETFSPLVDSVLHGFNGTIFAYGQTGTGKTHTMEGKPDDPGVIPRSFSHIFKHISEANQDQQYLVRASYLEIYQEEIRDLLSKGGDSKKQHRLELKERPDTGVYVKDLSPFVCKSQSEIEHVMTVGNMNRTVGPTNMNEHSSRSHAIFIITVECATPGDDEDGGGDPHITVGKLNLVDLAGSERQAKTGAEGDRLKEATKINLSLSALGNVISALVDGKSAHIPYRDSKLTRLLQDSLGGNAKTVMVANIGPSAFNYEETVTTLRYANRAKNIKNKPRVNEDPKDAMLREFQEEIARLKSQLSSRQTKSGKRRKSAKRRMVESTGSNGSGGGGVGVGGSAVPPPMDISMESSCAGSSCAAQEMTFSQAADDLEARLAIERELLEADTGMLSNEKEKLLGELTAKEAALKAEREERQRVAQRISALESKLLCGKGEGGGGSSGGVGGGVGSGGVGDDGGGANNMVERTNEQQKMLEKRRADLAERKRAERSAAQQLEASEEQGEELEKTYTSLQQEVETKTRKLRKLFTKLQSVKQDIVDVTEEHNRDRRDLEDTQQQLLKELKLKMLIIENFIPPNERKKLLARAAYDQEEDNWYMTGPQCGGGGGGGKSPNDANSGGGPVGVIAKRPVSAAGSRRPMSEYARLISVAHTNGGAASRYRGENIMRLSLDKGGRTTRDYEGPAVAPRVQAALDAAMLNVEPDIEVDVKALSSKNLAAVRGIKRNAAAAKAKIGGGGGGGGGGGRQAVTSYPSSRGLVPK